MVAGRSPDRLDATHPGRPGVALASLATVFPDLSASKAGAVPLPRLLTAIEAGKPHRASKAACPLFSAFTFGTKRTPRGSLRSTDNALHACAVVAEHDAGTIAPELARDKLAAFGIAATVYTTASHTPEAPRWRIIAPTLRALDKAEYPHMVARLNGLFAGAIARESFTVAQSYYFGRVNGRDFAAYHVEGAHVDELDELDAGALYPDHARTPGDGGTGPSGATDTAHRDTIRSGADGVQRALLALAARWIARGMAADDVAAALWALLDACEWKDRDPARWHARRDSIARCVQTAAAKFADRRERGADGRAEGGQDRTQRDAPPADDATYRPHADNTTAAAADPPPLDILRPLAAPPLRAADVPEVLGRFAEAHARATGFDPSILLAGGIGMAAAALSDEVRLCVSPRSGWFESARLWLSLIGGPGSGKTPGLKTTAAPIFALHRKLLAAWSAANAGAETVLPDAPPRPALYTSDATTEALADVLRDNPRGLLYFCDELESWLASHDAYRTGAGKDRGEWLRLYDGGPHQVNRVRRGAFFVPNWGCSLLSATTPAALRKLAPKLPDDGLLQRLLLVLVRPRELPDATLLRVETRQPAEAWHAALWRLYALPGAVVHLSAAARVAFDAEQAELHQLTLAFEDLHPPYAAHLAKRTAMLARLALTFHALESAEISADVSGDTMARAVRFMRRQERHAQAVYSAMLGADTGMALAKAIARAILASGLGEFNRRELTPKCKAFRDADEQTRLAALKLLSDCGWVTCTATTITHGTLWTVDKRVHTSFSEHGEAARAQRAAIRSRILGADDEA